MTFFMAVTDTTTLLPGDLTFAAEDEIVLELALLVRESQEDEVVASPQQLAVFHRDDRSGQVREVDVVPQVEPNGGSGSLVSFEVRAFGSYVVALEKPVP